jgi:Type II secretion system (T2SS), protein E, N-terminal domain
MLIVTAEKTEISIPRRPIVLPERTGNTLPYLAGLTNYPTPRLLHLFPYTLACRYRCVPVGVERGILTLATSQRLAPSLIEHFRTVTQHAIFQVRCETTMIDDMLNYWQRIIFV